MEVEVDAVVDVALEPEEVAACVSEAKVVLEADAAVLDAAEDLAAVDEAGKDVSRVSKFS